MTKYARTRQCAWQRAVLTPVPVQVPALVPVQVPALVPVHTPAPVHRPGQAHFTHYYLLCGLSVASHRLCLWGLACWAIYGIVARCRTFGHYHLPPLLNAASSWERLGNSNITTSPPHRLFQLQSKNIWKYFLSLRHDLA